MDGKNLFIEYIKRKKDIIIFAGAGTSMNSGLPSWVGLTESILNKIATLFNKPELKGLIDPMKSGLITPIDALKNVSDKVYRSEVYSVIREQLAIDNSKKLDLQTKLLSLSSKIVTTNYDLAFESASDDKLTVITNNRPDLLQTLHRSEKFIFKLHGDQKDLDHSVLFAEDYKKLYGAPNASTQELTKLFTDYTIVFVGVSFNDPYVSSLFDFIDTLYDGIKDKHFIITSEIKFDDFRQYLVPIKISAYNQADVLVDELVGIRQSENIIVEPIVNRLTKNTDKPTVQLLIPQPLDRPNIFNSELIISLFTSYSVRLSIEFFNSEKIRSIDNSEYIFIFSQRFKNQIVMEDENLKSKFLKLDELNQFASPQLKGLFLILEGTDDGFLDDCEFTIPLSIIFVEKKYKEYLVSMLHRLFIKKDINSIAASSHVFNKDLFTFAQVEKKGFDLIKSAPKISKYIDKKTLVKFVGRKSDQETLIRKILSLRFENKLLTIKGSGGIGKTTTISKVSIELAERGYFQKGVHFVSCNAIKSFENFEYAISQCYDLSSSKFLRDQIADTVYYKDRLIILDNFETLIFLEEYNKILELVSLLVDFSIVVTTSREILDLIFEDIYELRNLTTDEGVELFKSFYSNVKESEEKILRYDIVEKLLNNNPLAIKLISRGLPTSRDLKRLKEELEQDLFNGDEIQEIFESPEDSNIEKSNSLFHSINYSYKALSEKEKLAFEILSLFPDGVHMENLKHFAKANDNKQGKIGDREIKALDNKSLLENSNGFLKLQSIISRFSDYQFRQRDQTIRKAYYQQAFDFNFYLVNVLQGSTFNKHLTIRLSDANVNNYLKCFTFLNEIDITIEEKLEFIFDVSTVFRHIDQADDFLKALQQVIEETDDPAVLKVLQIIEQFVIYWVINFDRPKQVIDDLCSIEQLSEIYDDENGMHKILRRMLLNYIICEGEALKAIQFLIRHGVENCDISVDLYQLGYHELAETARLRQDKEFFDFEIDAANGKLVKSELTDYLKIIYVKNTLELTQATYIKSKYFSVTTDEIKKLVITNPYTKGLIQLMKAKQESDIQKKIDLFEKALENLFHIKYYYVECLYEYCNLLLTNNSKIINESILNKINIGIELSERYWFRFQLFKFKSLISDQGEFCDDYYPIPLEIDTIAKYIRQALEAKPVKKLT
ncbi:MAG TPA: SIR2 family protein [Sphingobacteriaceae bacterium]